MNPLPSLSETKLDTSENTTPRRSYEGLDPTDLECAITRVREEQFGVLLPCLHEFGLSGIRSLPQPMKCPTCRSNVESYADLESLDKLIPKMTEKREKLAKINRINAQYLAGHAQERKDVKEARIASALREGDLPLLFGEENSPQQIFSQPAIQIMNLMATRITQLTTEIEIQWNQRIKFQKILTVSHIVMLILVISVLYSYFNFMLKYK